MHEAHARFGIRLTPNAPLIVGRERELGLLRDRLDAAIHGQGGLVLISGEAGIGKTALADSLAREAIARGALPLVGHCYEIAESPPYGLWRGLFGRYRPTDGMSPLPPAFAQHGTVGVVASQVVLFNQVLDFLRAGAVSPPTGAHPLVLVLEDIQWGDPASLDLLRFIARALPSLPLLLVATLRVDGLTAGHPLDPLIPALVREADALRLDLRPLTEDDVRAYVAGRYALPGEDTARLARSLFARANGNPFFTTELLHTLEADGSLYRCAAGWALGALSGARVPPLLRQVIGTRLGQLGVEAVRLLTVAAVIGQEVPLDLWRAVSGTDDETIFALVERAVAARVIEETADGSGVTFAHALIRETLLEGMLAVRRRALHRTIAETLLVMTNPDVDAVAYHLKEVGDPRAPHWLTRAGLRAQRASAWQTAADHYTTALGLLPETAATANERGWLSFALGRMEAYYPLAAAGYLDRAERFAAQGNDRVLGVAIAYYRSLSQHNLGDVRGGIAGMEAVVAALRALTDEERTGLRERREWIGRPLEEDDGTGQLALFLAVAGRLAEARPLAARILDPARTPIDPRRGRGQAHADASLAAAVVAMHDGQPAAARRAARQAWQACDDLAAYDEAARALYIEALWIDAAYWRETTAERALLQQDLLNAWRKTSVSLMSYASDDLMRLPFAGVGGEWAMVRRLAEMLPLGSVTLEVIPRSILTPIAYAQGEAELVGRLVQETLPDGPATEPGGTNFFTALVLQRLAARMAMDADDLATAHAWLGAHDRWLAWSGATLGRAERALLWADYHRANGDSEMADGEARRALALATELRQPLVLIAADRLLGELDTATGRYDDAARHFDRAHALADACGAPYERTLTLLARAELCAATNERSAALALIAEARTIGAPLNARLALDRAEALQTRLSAASPQPAARFPDGLTGREVAVLQLLAAGKSNRAIAARLGITTRTAERHISNIYTKIGIYSRAETAAYAIRHGLA